MQDAIGYMVTRLAAETSGPDVRHFLRRLADEMDDEDLAP
jgi:hypothetical protein